MTNQQSNNDAVIQQQAVIDKLLSQKYEPIAVVGLGLRFPGSVHTLSDFAQMLETGTEGIGEIPNSRWDNSLYFDAEQGKPGRICTHSGGYLDQIDQFDPKFFAISPKEANNIDPQQRLMLELAWEALEQANIDPQQLRGAKGSVYIGVSTVDYTREILELPDDALVNQMGTGAANSAISGRISYFLGLRGPCMSLDTACSSSLVAVHLAAQGLRNQEADIAICGGVNIIHHPSSHIIFSHANMLSTDGRCKTFDESADGYGRSEGAAVMILKRLSDAVRDQDTVLALIRGSAVMQDGESGGLTVPNGTAQELVMNAALHHAMLRPSDINYVEAHGTGTPLGDPIEINSINKVFSRDYDHEHPIKVASVKTNLGHMEAAAGMGGLIKVILQMKSQQIYPHLHLHQPSTHIPWEQLAIRVPTKLESWTDEKKRAIVNSFGFAGTIASVVLEQAPAKTFNAQDTATERYIFTLSAKSQPALLKQVDNYLSLATQLDNTKLAAFCHTSNLGRAHFSHRLAASVATVEELIETLQKWHDHPDIIENNGQKATRYKQHKIAMMFTGQGSQYIGMGAKLYQTNPTFQAWVDQIDALFLPHLGLSVLDVILNRVDGAVDRLNETQYTQPALFTIEYSLAQLWLSYGIEPSVLIGHSIGEVVAACVAGLFSLKDAVALVAKRAQLMQSVQQLGGMLAIQSAPEQIEPLLASYDQVSFGAFNAPDQCVISGCREALAQISTRLQAQSISCKQLNVSHAFHSVHMEEVFAEFRTFMAGIQFQEPAMTFISNVTGQAAKFSQVATAEYWVQHIRQPVAFEQGMKAIAQRGKHIYLEVGASPHLLSLGKRCIDATEQVWLASLENGKNDDETLKLALVSLYQLGQNLQWKGIHATEHYEKIDLPLYPFERKRYWLTAAKKTQNTSSTHPLLGHLVAHPSQGIEFKAQITTNHPSYLADHVVMGKIIFPGAGYMEIVLALQDALCGHTRMAVHDFYIHQPLMMSNEAPTYLLTRALQQPNGDYAVDIYSASQPDYQGSLHRHLSCMLSKTESTQVSASTFPSVQTYQAKNAADHQMYQDFMDVGLCYGEQFQKVSYCEKLDQDTVYGEILSHPADAVEILNPTLLDAVLHTMAHIVPPGQTLLPVGFQQFQLYRKPRGLLQSKVTLRHDQQDDRFDILADLVMKSEGEVVFVARGLGLKAVKSVESKAQNSFIHTLNWSKQPLHPDHYQEFHALLIGNSPLVEASQIVRQYSDNLACVEHVSQVEAYLQQHPSCHQLVYFWENITTGDSHCSLEADCRHNFEAVLQLVQMLEAKYPTRNLQFVFVTHGAQCLPCDANLAIALKQIQQSTLWGFTTVLNSEFGRFKAKMIDFSPEESAEIRYRSLLQELFLGTEHEYQIAFRAGTRYVHRLEVQSQHDHNFKLGVREYGTFANIEQQTINTVAPTGDEILVEVRAAGVNFKDVLNVLGMLRQHAADAGIDYQDLPLGFEAAGVVCACGPDAEFKVGDEVIVSQLGCMQKQITVSSQVAVRKPTNITFAQAAGIATAYITSYYALHRLANMKQGDKVLIHAAAGGVGQAAIQLAKRAGAIIYATASEPKWPFLQRLHLDGIMNSRDLTFVDAIKESTQDQGVDILLNCLNKDFIPAGLDIMAEHGRFVEIGKIGVWTSDQVQTRRPDVEYHQFDLSELPQKQLNAINKEILTEIVSLIEREEIAALPVTTYSLNEVEEAFGVLSRGQNIGKIVLSFEQQTSNLNQQPLKIQPDVHYLITGGYGALGIKAARWLVERGATLITLVGRRLPTAEQLTHIQQQVGLADLQCLTADIAQPEAVATLVAQLNQDGKRLAGIIHAAGVLADSPIASLQWPQFAKVFAPKVVGTWLLHQATARYQPLDFFIGYSSIASVIGSVSQANYAAANAFIDSLMQYRVANGAQGLSINWGPWAEVGMAAELTEGQIKAIEEKGIRYIPVKKGMATLDALGHSRVAQAVVGEYDWVQFHHRLPIENNLYQGFLRKESTTTTLFVLEELMLLPTVERAAQILLYVRTLTASVLQFDVVDDVEPDALFANLGLDSLVAVELRNVLEKAFKLPLPSSIIFDYPSIPALASHITEQLMGDLASQPAATVKEEINQRTAPSLEQKPKGLARLLQSLVK